MSNYGLRILYSLLNRVPNTGCERVYTPWPDMADRLRDSSTPLYGLESHRPLSEFNVLGFSLQSELSYTNVLYTLDLGGIPLRSAERSAKHPLIVAGGPCCVNPLPMNRFIDCFCIGDGEEVMADVVTAYRQWNRANRDDLLQTLAGIDGVYVPLKHKGSVVRRRPGQRVARGRFSVSAGAAVVRDCPRPADAGDCAGLHAGLPVLPGRDAEPAVPVPAGG